MEIPQNKSTRISMLFRHSDVSHSAFRRLTTSSTFADAAKSDGYANLFYGILVAFGVCSGAIKFDLQIVTSRMENANVSAINKVSASAPRSGAHPYAQLQLWSI
jgi:hypothetical protein